MIIKMKLQMSLHLRAQIDQTETCRRTRADLLHFACSFYATRSCQKKGIDDSDLVSQTYILEADNANLKGNVEGCPITQ